MTDWIEGFLSYTSHITSPELFRKWAAIYTLGAAIERKVWIRTSSGVLYPNLYVVLVGPPGVGKTEVTWRCRDLLTSLGELHLAPSSVTKASLIDALNNANRHLIRPNETPAAIVFNSLQVVSNELGVLLPGYENEFMNTLTDLYDCKYYAETRRTRDLSIEIKAPQLSIMAACTPSYLNAVMPEGAWDQGFISRTFLIYNGEQVLRPLFEFASEDEEETKTLKALLKSKHKLYGKMSFTPGAAKRMEAWHISGGDPRPDHPKLFHYCSRRTVHALKLCLIASVSDSDELIVTEDHVGRAIDWLIEAELYMEEIFKEMGGGTHGEIIKDVWHFIFKAYMKAGKKSVNEARVINFVSQKTPAHNVARILEVMEKSNLIKRAMTDGYIGYIPLGKDQ